MRYARALAMVLLLVFLFLAPWLVGQKRPPREIQDDQRTKLATYLQANALTPEEYVASKFGDHDIILLGEHHFIRHDVELVRALIPILYRIGVRDLGIEFGCYELQAEADALVTAEDYHEGQARWLMFNWASFWPYVEYLALYRAAWELNRSLPSGAPKFRIVGLDYRPRWDLVGEKMSTKLWRQVFHKGDRDKHMASVVMREFVDRGRKALIYAGQFHAATRFAFPVYDFVRRKTTGIADKTMGRRIYRKIRGQAFNICLHYPWNSVDGPKSYDYPLGGVIDALMKGFEPRRLGFDVKGSPFGQLPDRKAVYSRTRTNFMFEDFCDGYIFSRPFSEYEGCDVDPLFVTDDNLAEAVAFLPTAAIKKKIFTPAQFLAKFKGDADFKRRYPDLE